MPRYIAFLRGVSPMNLKMADLRDALETAGFTNVKTLLSSGNAAFDSGTRSTAKLEREIEAALSKRLDRTFHTIVRSASDLQKLIESDPYAKFHLPKNAKRVVTFARRLPAPKQPLPLERDGARILCMTDREAFSVYVPSPRGPVFMELIKTTFGSEVTTRTWETVTKCANA